MHFISRKLIAALIAFSLAFSTLWATSPEALADAIKTDSYIQEIAEHHVHADFANHKDQTTQSQHCNDGCHISVHLLGFAETPVATDFGLIESQATFLFSDNLSDNPYLQGPFRPPLAVSLV